MTLTKAVNAASSAKRCCTRCGKEVARSELFVMKIAFHMLGEPASQKRSRTVEWLCPECLGQSDEWNIPERSHTKVGKSVDVTCDECGGQFPRTQIMVSKVIFNPLGEANRTVRSRTRAWKCAIALEADSSGDKRSVTFDDSCCMAKDKVYNLPEYRSSPGAREAEARGISQ